MYVLDPISMKTLQKFILLTLLSCKLTAFPTSFYFCTCQLFEVIWLKFSWPLLCQLCA